MEFIKEINVLENTLTRKEDFITSLGTSSVLLTALDTLDIYNPDGTIIDAPRYLKAIARYAAAYTDSSYFIKLKGPYNDNYQELTNYIESNHIKLVLDINATKNNSDILRIVPLNNVDKTILHELEEAFKEHNLSNIEITEPPTINIDADCIKIELPEIYRDLNNPIYLEKTCKALISFIKMYINISD